MPAAPEEDVRMLDVRAHLDARRSCGVVLGKLEDKVEHETSEGAFTGDHVAVPLEDVTLKGARGDSAEGLVEHGGQVAHEALSGPGGHVAVLLVPLAR